jgi:hypothetical protein
MLACLQADFYGGPQPKKGKSNAGQNTMKHKEFKRKDLAEMGGNSE